MERAATERESLKHPPGKARTAREQDRGVGAWEVTQSGFSQPGGSGFFSGVPETPSTHSKNYYVVRSATQFMPPEDRKSRTIRFARLSLEPIPSLEASSSNSYRSDLDADLLRGLIDFDTDLNSLLRGTDMGYKLDSGSWSFGDVEVGDDYISATLGKERTDTNRVRDRQQRGFREVDRTDHDLAHFVIDLDNSYMAYESRHNIGGKAPYRILRAAFNNWYEGEEELQIKLETHQKDIDEELNTLSRVKQIHFSSLHPTNPNSTSRSEPMDKVLRNGNVGSMLMTARGEDINREEPILDGGIHLADEGYGDAVVTGETADGEEKVVTTGERPVESKRWIAEDGTINREQLIDSIIEQVSEQDR